MAIDRYSYPCTAIVGQEQMKLALVLNAINPSIGGVLIRGEKGTGKSTAVRALAKLLPEQKVVEGCHFGCHPEDPEDWCLDCRERSRSGELGSAPGGVLSPPGRSRRSLAAKRRRFSSRGTLKRSRGSSCVPPGLHDGPRRSSPPRREAARSSSGDSHRRPLANHFSWISACRACSCLKVGRSSSRVFARKDVGFPSRMIVQ